MRVRYIEKRASGLNSNSNVGAKVVKFSIDVATKALNRFPNVKKNTTTRMASINSPFKRYTKNCAFCGVPSDNAYPKNEIIELLGECGGSISQLESELQCSQCHR
jgi:hypothetical protein